MCFSIKGACTGMQSEGLKERIFNNLKLERHQKYYLDIQKSNQIISSSVGHDFPSRSFSFTCLDDCAYMGRSSQNRTFAFLLF